MKSPSFDGDAFEAAYIFSSLFLQVTDFGVSLIIEKTFIFSPRFTGSHA